MSELFPTHSSDVSDTVQNLRTALHQYDHEYYILGQSSVSDREYDVLYDRLVQIEKQFPNLVTPDSPTQRVGSDLSSDFPEFRHTIPVLSLDKAYSTPEITTWVKRCGAGHGSFSCILEEKIDGLSLVLYYENGVLARAVTRGNGEIGNDVSANVRTIRDVPLRLSRPISGAFRGEVFLQKDDFETLNKQQETAYANPRNLAGGTLRRAKSSEVAAVPLRIFVYEGYYDDSPSTHGALLKDLNTLGFRTNPRTAILTLPDAMTDFETWISEETKARSTLPYEIDGLVIKIDDLELREDLGYTGHHPRWAIAYKFESPQGQTRVISIDVQVGRTGRITPVARVEPVAVGGTTIQNVTLHNQDYIDALELAPGDLVTVSRRGDVIPAVEKVIEKGDGVPWHLPTTCPSCASELSKDGAHHFCVNFACPDRKRGRLYFFVARDQMDIEGLGPETIDFLMAQEIVHDIPDLYRLPWDRLRTFAGWGDKRVDNLAAAVKKSKGQRFSILLPSFGLPDIGTKVTELLILAGYRSVADLYHLVDTQTPQALLEIKGIGPKTAEKLWAELSDPRFRRMVAELESLGLSFVEPESTGAASSRKDAALVDAGLQQIFEGQTWCVTGTFERFKPRSIAMDEILKRGGTEIDSVTKATTHLLAGEGAGSKLEKAQKMGVAIVTEAQFVQWLEA